MAPSSPVNLMQDGADWCARRIAERYDCHGLGVFENDLWWSAWLTLVGPGPLMLTSQPPERYGRRLGRAHGLAGAIREDAGDFAAGAGVEWDGQEPEGRL